VKILTTAADVIHSFAIPAFWVKMDAVPGRVNETWFKVDKPGVYFGQCSELCGTKHAFMPIAIEVLPRDKFDAWVAAKQKENGIEPNAATAEAAPAATPAA
jgi:cytochrome c oxidase subunit 2